MRGTTSNTNTFTKCTEKFFMFINAETLRNSYPNFIIKGMRKVHLKLEGSPKAHLRTSNLI